MITLKSKFLGALCDGCPYLEPCVEAVKSPDDTQVILATGCSNYEKCRDISSYIQKQLKNSTDILKLNAVTGAFDNIVEGIPSSGIQVFDVFDPSRQPEGVSCLSNIAKDITDQAQNKLKAAEKSERANWIVWAGWKGNHNQRIDNAKCSKCGLIHPTVKGSLSKLSPICPNCGSTMGVILKG